MITGAEAPDAGAFRVGETVQIGYVNQERDLDPDKTVWQVISGGADFIQLGTREVNSRAYVGRFNFGGSDQQKKVGTLSGGERGRREAGRGTGRLSARLQQCRGGQRRCASGAESWPRRDRRDYRAARQRQML